MKRTKATFFSKAHPLVGRYCLAVQDLMIGYELLTAKIPEPSRERIRRETAKSFRRLTKMVRDLASYGELRLVEEQLCELLGEMGDE